MQNNNVMPRTIRLIGLLLGLLALQAGAQTAQTPHYEYGDTTNVIDIGYGVLATPMSVLGEVMSRDRILKNAATQLKMKFIFHPYEKGVDSLQPLLDGKLDGAMPTDVVVLDAIARSDIVLLGYVRQSFSTVVGPRGSSMAELKGKRIGNSLGTSGHSALLQGLTGAGLGEKDVTLVQMNVRDMPEALIAGRIDAFAAWEPTPSTVLRLHPARFTSLHKQISPAYLVISRKMSRENPEAARLLTASLHRAVRWLQKSRANLLAASTWTLAAMHRYTGQTPAMSGEEIAALTRSDLLNIAGAPLIPANEAHVNSALWRTFEFYKASGKLPARMSWSKVQESFDIEHTTQVTSNAKRYHLDEFDYER
jgi:NitT/TauT family transport system substrate-binding protein